MLSVKNIMHKKVQNNAFFCSLGYLKIKTNIINKYNQWKM